MATLTTAEIFGISTCPCGCRSGPLADHRLRRHGLRGFAIISMSTGKKRYIHPKEAGFLNTRMPSAPLPHPARHALCLVGQIAAPLQAVWIFAHVVNWIIQIHAKRPGRSALGYVHEYQHKLLRDRLLHWITPSMFRSRTLTLKEEGEPDVLITLKSPASLAQVKAAAAETALQGWGGAVHVQPSGHIQTDQELIASATDRLHCQINRQKKRQAIAFPASTDKRPLRAAGPETAELTWDETAVLHNLQVILNYAACIDSRPWGAITPAQAHELLCATPRPLPNELHLIDRAVIIFPYNNHWTLLTLEPSEDHTQAIYWDAPATPNQQAAQDLTFDICSLMGWPSPHIQHKHIFASTSNGDCGVLAIVHFGWHLDLWDHLPDERIKQWHLDFATTPSGPCLRAGGSTEHDTVSAGLQIQMDRLQRTPRPHR